MLHSAAKIHALSILMGMGAANVPEEELNKILLMGNAEKFGLHLYFDYKATKARRDIAIEADLLGDGWVQPYCQSMVALS